MTEMEMKKKLYSMYQLDWMLTHGYSLADVIQGISDYGDNWETESGFNGEMWSSFEEFCDNEIEDNAMLFLICDMRDHEELEAAYRKYMGLE